MNRSKWKGPYFKKKIFNSIKNKNKKIQTDCRNSIITPKFLKITFDVYNGIIFQKLEINEEMIGFKLGEFSLTRKKFTFKKKKRGTKN